MYTFKNMITYFILKCLFLKYNWDNYPKPHLSSWLNFYGQTSHIVNNRSRERYESMTSGAH